MWKKCVLDQLNLRYGKCVLGQLNLVQTKPLQLELPQTTLKMAQTSTRHLIKLPTMFVEVFWRRILMFSVIAIVICHCIETLSLQWILQRMTVLSTLLSKRLGTVVAQVNMVLFNVVVKGPAWSTTIGYLLWFFISEIDWQENSLSRQSGQWAVCRWGRCPQDGRWISSRCPLLSIPGPSPPPSSNVPPPGRSSLLFPVGCHPPHPLDGLHQHHRRRG